MLTALRIVPIYGLALVLVGVSVAADEPPKPEPPRAFRPVARPLVPAVTGAARTGVDRFILAALEAKGVTLGPEADRATLIRRVCFDLTGLPPAVTEVEGYLADRSPDAYE